MIKKLQANNLQIYQQDEGEYTLVLLHGYGANGRDLLSLGSELPANIRLLFPEGPIKLAEFYMDAHAWFMIDLETLSFDHQQYEESSLQIGQALEELKINPAKTIIGGFSQGAMMALEVVLRAQMPFLGLVLFSTTPVNLESLPKRASYPTPFLQTHGFYDDLLPFPKAEDLYKALSKAGWQGKFVNFPGGHEIPAVVVKEFKDFVYAQMAL